MKISVERLPNGQMEVKKGNLTIRQSIVQGINFTDCTILNEKGNYQCISKHDPRLTDDMWAALRMLKLYS